MRLIPNPSTAGLDRTAYLPFSLCSSQSNPISPSSIRFRPSRSIAGGCRLGWGFRGRCYSVIGEFKEPMDSSKESQGLNRDLYPPIEPYSSGFLKVSDLHTLYWEQSGNPSGHPVVFLHGGPGAGTSANNRRFFDPEFYRIILFDQRGAGKSTPHACLEENTTWDLVNDIEKLREHLEIPEWQVFGGSWGSTLALAYSQSHPDKVTGIILRGIFLLRKKELDWFYEGGAAAIFPDAWEPFRDFIPENERSCFIDAYNKRLNSNDTDVKVMAAKIWTTWELPHELYARRNSRCSPSWSFRCDTRTHIEDIVDNPACHSDGHGGAHVPEVKSARDMEIECLSDGSSSSNNFQTPKWGKFSNELSTRENSLTGSTDLSMARLTSQEATEFCEVSSTLIGLDTEPFSTDQADHSSSRICSQPSDPTSSQKPHHLHVPQFSKVNPEGRVPNLDSLEEGSLSFKLSFSSKDFSAEESYHCSSDGWSRRSFSEFMLSYDSSQRDSKKTLPSSSSFPSDMQTCGLCSKLLNQRASWRGNEICIAAVLVCGHVYHAECLETVTPEASKFDPSCPSCAHGESSARKALVKSNSKTRSKISRRAVADIDAGGTFMPESQKTGSCSLKEQRLVASGSQKSSSGRSFLRRHFSIGSRSIKLFPEKDSLRKNGFWARYR